MRLFVAIDIPDAVRDELAALQSRLKPLAKLSWSPVANLHITTKFVGEWPETRLDEMQEALAEVARLKSVQGPLAIEIRGLGWFPNARSPRVFWAGIEAGERLAELARVTEEAVAKLGVPVEDRPFSPHLTLARIREKVPLNALRDAVASLESKSFGGFEASAFTLYLSAAGRYTRLKEFVIASS